MGQGEPLVATGSASNLQPGSAELARNQAENCSHRLSNPPFPHGIALEHSFALGNRSTGGPALFIRGICGGFILLLPGRIFTQTPRISPLIALVIVCGHVPKAQSILISSTYNQYIPVVPTSLTFKFQALAKPWLK